MLSRISLTFSLFFAFGFAYCQDKNTAQITESKQKAWVDSVFNQLTPEQKLGQLFMVAAYSNRNEQHAEEIEKIITQYNVGGLIFFQGGPHRQAKLTNRFQAKSKIPLLIGIDGEWGLGMRLDSTMSFPKQMTLGAIASDDYIYRMGKEVARQCKRMGIHINFGPVVDVNSNSANPVIGMRSFGEDKENVARKGIAYMKGMQHNGIMANAKHFPGHGDTDADSHFTLPVVNHNKKRLSEIELYPFQRLIDDSVMSIMVGHLYVPALDKTPNQATTLSKNVVTELLKKNMKFEGLIFTDALNMKGVSKFFKPGEVDAKALVAGNDVLLFPENVPEALVQIEKAISNKEITQKEIDKKVKKILAAKYNLGLNNYKPVVLNNLYNDLNTPEAKAFLQELYAKATTIVRNDEMRLPFRALDTTQFVSVTIGAEKGNIFQRMLNNYATFEHFHVSSKAKETVFDTVYRNIKGQKTVIVSFHNIIGSAARNYGISDSALSFIRRLQQKHHVVVVAFGNAYSLKNFSGVPSLVCGYENNETTQRVVPQILFGALEASGKLPVTASADIKSGDGFNLASLSRLRYGSPEAVNMSTKILDKIDSIASIIVNDSTTPGCQILIAKDGMVVYSKSFGYHGYDKQQPVEDETLYDIASITKVAGTLQAVMFLQERGLLDVTKKASDYLPELKGTNKEDMTISSILTHQAGLIPFIPYWKRTVKTIDLTNIFYCTTRDNWFCNEVSPGVYSMKTMEDTLWRWTINSELLHTNKYGKYDYKYSDLGFYIMKKLVENKLGEPMEDFLESNIYAPLGLATMTFNPLTKFDTSRIAPTEKDNYFRASLIRGTVHDQGAAMFGGVGGHAGLFCNANDLAVLMQMNMQNGYYGGQNYFMPETIPFFSKKYFSKNRRGLGWDKPLPTGGGPTSRYASPKTFGHTGFTGTAAWADPDHNMVFVFLSNRVHPFAENLKLIQNNIRTKIHDIAYEAIKSNLPNILEPLVGTN